MSMTQSQMRKNDIACGIGVHRKTPKSNGKLCEFHVTWEIDLDAKSHEAAAEAAQDMMRDAEINWSFNVKQNGKRNANEKRVDLANEQ